MHVLEAITPSRIGGAETFVTRLTLDLAAAGDEVEIFCPSGRPLMPYLQRHGISALSWKTYGKVDPRTLIGLAAHIRTHHVDVLHTHLSTATFLGSLAARLARVPCVAHAHGMGTVGWYRFADQVIAVSEAVRRHLIAEGIPGHRIHVVRNGVCLSEFTPQPVADAKRVCGLDPRKLRVGIFGRMSPEKGHAVALEAWPWVVREHPGARLVLAGEGKCEGDLRALVGRLGLGAHVEFPGFLEDPRPCMSACDLVLLPSFKEGLPLSAVEAMAIGRPIVASDAGGLPEVVEDGETGLIVPRGEPQLLTVAINRLLRDPGLRARMGQAGRRRAEERFDGAKQLTALRQVFASARQHA